MTDLVLDYGNLPWKFEAVQGADYSDDITLYQDEDATDPVDLTGASIAGTLQYEIDLPVLTDVNLTFEYTPATLAVGNFTQKVSDTDLDNLVIEGYKVSLILSVEITQASGDVLKYYGYLVVQRAV